MNEMAVLIELIFDMVFGTPDTDLNLRFRVVPIAAWQFELDCSRRPVTVPGCWNVICK